MIKKLNFVYDVKSGDVLAPVFVPSHVSAIRNYISISDSDKDAIFNKFPGDFALVTCDFSYPELAVTQQDITSFNEIVSLNSLKSSSLPKVSCESGDVNVSTEN